MKINCCRIKLILKAYLNHMKMLWILKVYLFKLKKLMIDFREKNKGSNRDLIIEKTKLYQILMTW
jgi:hypothetical protein